VALRPAIDCVVKKSPSSITRLTKTFAMGFFGGFIGGVTLTSSILYLTVAGNRQTRLRQSTILAQENRVLLDLIEPQILQSEPTARVVRGGFVEMAKDRWNAEVEGLLRLTYNTDWNQVRANWVDRALKLASGTIKMVSGTVESPQQRREG